MNKRRAKRISHDEVGLQIAPMIDVTMLLLFFFMLSTTLQSKRANDGIELPTTKSARDVQATEGSIVILINRAGQISVNGTPTSVTKIASDVAKNMSAASRQKWVAEVNADSNTPSATIKKVVSAVTESGVAQISYVIRTD